MRRRPDRSGTPRAKPGGGAVSPVILSLRPKVVAGRRVLGDLPYLTDSAVAQVEDENDLVIENPAVALSMTVMQADRVLFATHYVVKIDSHSAARAREQLPKVGETGVSPLLVASEATVTGHVPDGILGKQLG